MWIMNLVWPLTALFGSLIWLAGYYLWGRAALRSGENRGDPPFAISVATGASHCGAGCTLGDIIVEWLAFAVPAVAVWFGWHLLFDQKLIAIWVPDFIFAFLIGIVFRYYAIKAKRDMSPAQGIIAALKADVASINAWQVGM